jgi:flagellar biosynthetic protein FlhB
MADGSKTEQPTERRRTKARDKGQVTRSRELPGTLATAAVLGWLATRSSQDLFGWSAFYRNLLQFSATRELTLASPVLQWSVSFAMRWALLPMLAAWTVGTLSTLAQGGFVFSAEALAWKPERMSPAQKLQQLFSAAGLSNILKSLIPFAFILWLTISQMRSDWPVLAGLSQFGVLAAAGWILQRMLGLAWKFCLVLLLWAGVDYLLQRQRSESQLKMSREEVKEEFKESEGNPQIKAKIRRLQRQVRRQQMRQAVKKASVVVTNPTHYALALDYRPEMAAPMLVAKGLDRFAEEIKQIAIWHEVPLVENRALAHALYRTVEVGQVIPSKLYTAVAEVLAAVYRAQAKLQRK